MQVHTPIFQTHKTNSNFYESCKSFCEKYHQCQTCGNKLWEKKVINFIILDFLAILFGSIIVVGKYVVDMALIDLASLSSIMLSCSTLVYFLPKLQGLTSTIGFPRILTCSIYNFHLFQHKCQIFYEKFNKIQIILINDEVAFIL